MNKQFKKLVFCLLFLVSFSVLADAFEETQQAAENGNALAQARLASIYFLGRDNQEKNEKLASKWMEKAAKQGLVEAQVVVAAMYDTGVGFKFNKQKATRWYEKAAKQGHGTSMALLGKNPTAQGSVQFSYQSMRLSASKSIPRQYAINFLKKKK